MSSSDVTSSFYPLSFIVRYIHHFTSQLAGIREVKVQIRILRDSISNDVSRFLNLYRYMTSKAIRTRLLKENLISYEMQKDRCAANTSRVFAKSENSFVRENNLPSLRITRRAKLFCRTEYVIIAGVLFVRFAE